MFSFHYYTQLFLHTPLLNLHPPFNRHFLNDTKYEPVIFEKSTPRQQQLLNCEGGPPF